MAAVGIVMTNLKAVEYFQHALESANTNLGMTFMYPILKVIRKSTCMYTASPPDPTVPVKS